MILIAPGVLSTDELAGVRASLQSARFVDGRVSAGPAAREQKHVLQLERAGDGQREVGELIARALLRHPRVQAAALPRSVRHPTINRYEPGMYYGPHLDSPVMRGSLPMRADVSVTVFLCDPGDYAGGELSIETDQGPRLLKAAAGDAVLYASGAVHQVKPVESGVRLVAVTWLQSLVRSPEQRRVLYELGETIALLKRQATKLEGDALLQLKATHNALMRMWVEG